MDESKGIVFALDWINKEEVAEILKFLTSHGLDFDIASPYRSVGAPVQIQREIVIQGDTEELENQMTTSIDFLLVSRKKYDFMIVAGGRSDHYTKKGSSLSYMIRDFLILNKPLSCLLKESLHLTYDGVSSEGRIDQRVCLGPEFVFAIGDLMRYNITTDYHQCMGDSRCSWYMNDAWRQWKTTLKAIK
ncbi:MAG: hypothetical protein KI790_13850 [Cyclobacteriaceae bacterium]|nr:hypothetical protein [Cyclobacteriaceae bacterium HetDA_MAG_MS6]